jgi:hypothetical protein
MGYLLDNDDSDLDARGKRPAPLVRQLDPAALSHGQRQLLAAARASLHNRR